MDVKSFFEILSHELKQEVNEDSNSGYEYINLKGTIFYINECIKELVQINGNPFRTEEDFSFNEETAKFRLPDIYNSASFYHAPDGWHSISDGSDRTARVRAINGRELRFNPPLRVHEKITMSVVKYPPDVFTADDTIDFPEHFMRLLRLHMMSRIMGRKGKAMADNIQAEYNFKMAQWKLYNKPAVNTSLMYFEGYGFGG